jgi:hypothetical protein
MICVSVFKISKRLFVGKKPPEEIIVNARLKELKLLMDNKFKTTNMSKVKPK